MHPEQHIQDLLDLLQEIASVTFGDSLPAPCREVPGSAQVELQESSVGAALTLRDDGVGRCLEASGPRARDLRPLRACRHHPQNKEGPDQWTGLLLVSFRKGRSSAREETTMRQSRVRKASHGSEIGEMFLEIPGMQTTKTRLQKMQHFWKCLARLYNA